MAQHRIRTVHLRNMDLDRFAMSGTDQAFNLARLLPIQVEGYRNCVLGALEQDSDNPALLSELAFVDGFLAGQSVRAPSVRAA